MRNKLYCRMISVEPLSHFFESYSNQGQVLMHEDNYRQLCHICFDFCRSQDSSVPPFSRITLSHIYWVLYMLIQNSYLRDVLIKIMTSASGVEIRIAFLICNLQSLYEIELGHYFCAEFVGDVTNQSILVDAGKLM